MKALLDNGQFPRFSSDRGRSILEYTKQVLTNDSFEYIRDEMKGGGLVELELNGCSIFVFTWEYRR